MLPVACILWLAKLFMECHVSYSYIVIIPTFKEIGLRPKCLIEMLHSLNVLPLKKHNLHVLLFILGNMLLSEIW